MLLAVEHGPASDEPVEQFAERIDVAPGPYFRSAPVGELGWRELPSSYCFVSQGVPLAVCDEGDTEVCQYRSTTFLPQEYVSRFYVTVDDVGVMNHGKSVCKTSDKGQSSAYVSAPRVRVIRNATTLAILHDQVDGRLFDLGVYDAHNRVGLQATQDIDLGRKARVAFRIPETLKHVFTIVP